MKLLQEQPIVELENFIKFDCFNSDYISNIVLTNDLENIRSAFEKFMDLLIESIKEVYE